MQRLLRIEIVGDLMLKIPCGYNGSRHVFGIYRKDSFDVVIDTVANSIATQPSFSPGTVESRFFFSPLGRDVCVRVRVCVVGLIRAELG